MRYCFFILLIILWCGCRGGCKFPAPYKPNDPPHATFEFEFDGRVEKLEDAFYSANLQYVEVDYNNEWQHLPTFRFTISRPDTTVTYVASLADCQSIYYLVKWNDDWKCNSSSVLVNEYFSNIDSLPPAAARRLFSQTVIRPLKEIMDTMKVEYHWVIEKSPDSTIVKILDHNNSLRKSHFFSMDSIGNSIAEKEMHSYVRDSIIHYKYNQQQRYVYLERRHASLR
ncbi:MAG: hypothetical protein EOO88_47870 [Pedobacter sp.]|nr:MAG: hypothetical protein EOO88_47870 [Pedobacter sp.]